MQRCLCGIFIILTNFLPAQVPDFEWAKQFGGQGAKTVVEAIATDQNGNVYTIGNYTGTVDFDPGSGSYPLSSASSNFITKLDSSGNFLWALNLDITTTSLAADKDGNVLVLGTFDGIVDADPGLTVFSVGSGTNSLSTLVLKLDGNGNFVWAKAFLGTSFRCVGNIIVLDQAQNIYVSGSFTEKTDFDPGAGTYYLLSSQHFDNHSAASGVFLPTFFLCKLDSSGNFSFAKSSGQFLFSRAYCVVNSLGESMSIYESKTAYGGGQGILFEKRAPNGNMLWKKHIAYGSLSVATAAVDKNGNYWIAGQFSGLVDFDPGPDIHDYSTPTQYDKGMYVLRLDSSGNFGWAVHFDNLGSSIQPCKLITDAAGNCYAGGIFSGDINFEPDGSQVLSSGNGNGFILKLNSYPSYMSLDWVKQIGMGGQCNIRDLSADRFGNIYSAGSFTGTVVLDSDQTQITAIGSQDAFVHKLGGAIVTAIKSYETGNEMHFFPNPVNGPAYFNTTTRINHGKFIVYDANGKRVLENKDINGKSFEINLSALQPGFYVVEISDDQYSARAEIIKE